MTTAPITQPPQAASTTSSQTSLPVVWAIGFLKSIGAPTTQNNIDNVLRWGNAESGGKQTYGGWNNFNPLNIVTQAGDNSTGAGGQQGDIANFGDVSSGVAASARLFSGNPNASGIIATLRNNGSTDQLNGSAVNGFYSTWGGSINLAGASPTTSNATTTGVIGNVINGVTGTLTLPAKILSLFGDWRYFVEVGAGLLMIVVGIIFVAKDTGAIARARHDATAAGVGVAAAV